VDDPFLSTAVRSLFNSAFVDGPLERLLDGVFRFGLDFDAVRGAILVKEKINKKDTSKTFY